jgi:hypothetical protein
MGSFASAFVLGLCTMRRMTSIMCQGEAVISESTVCEYLHALNAKLDALVGEIHMVHEENRILRHRVEEITWIDKTRRFSDAFLISWSYVGKSNCSTAMKDICERLQTIQHCYVAHINNELFFYDDASYPEDRQHAIDIVGGDMNFRLVEYELVNSETQAMLCCCFIFVQHGFVDLTALPTDISLSMLPRLSWRNPGDVSVPRGDVIEQFRRWSDVAEYDGNTLRILERMNIRALLS